MFLLSLILPIVMLLSFYILVRVDVIANNLSLTVVRYSFIYFAFYFVIAAYAHYYLNIFVDLYVEDTLDILINLNIINSIGLFLTILGYIFSKKINVRTSFSFSVDFKKIKNRSLFFIVIGLLLSIYLFKYDFSSVIKSVDESNENSILIYMFVENTPLLMGWFFIGYYKSKDKIPSAYSFYFMLLIIVLTSLIVSGTRGSRISIILQISSFILLYSSVYKKVKFRNILIALFFAFTFNSYFTIYKYGGIEAIEDYIATGYKPTYISDYQDSRKVILHDLGRSDVQAVIYDRVIKGDYSPSYVPNSYIYSLNLLVPSSLRFDEYFYSKEQLGYSAQYMTTLSKENKSSRIYGIMGESLLNFGFLGVFLSFFVFGFVIQKTLIAYKNSVSNGLILFIPLIVLFPIYYLFYDFGNILFMVVKTWLIAILIFLSASKLKRKINVY